MITWLKNFVRSLSGLNPVNVAFEPDSLSRSYQSGDNVAPARREVAVYPPVDTGITVATVDEIIESQKVFIARLKILAGGTTEHYEKYYLAIVKNLAAYIQLLPASQTTNHIGAGGLFSLCLEMGFYAMQAADGVIFAGQVVLEERRELEPRWRYATFLAAFCGELYRIVSDMAVTDAHGEVWPKYMKSLTQWTEEKGIQRIFVQWHKVKQVQTLTPGRSDVAIIISKIIPDYSFNYLDDVSKDIIPVVLAVASGASNRGDHQVAKIVADTREKIFERDDATKKVNYGRFTVGNHLEPYFLDAMRSLVRSGAWKVNEQKSRLWYGESGLYLIWKSGGKEILAELASAGIQGAPSDLSTLAEMLCSAKLLDMNQGQPYFDLTPPGSAVAYQSVKISKALAILESDNIPLAAISLASPSAAVVIPKEITPKAEINVKSPGKEPVAEPKEKTGSKPGIDITPKAEIRVQVEPIDAQRDLLSFQTDLPEMPDNGPSELPPVFENSSMFGIDAMPSADGFDSGSPAPDDYAPPFVPEEASSLPKKGAGVPPKENQTWNKGGKDVNAVIGPVDVVQPNFSENVNEKFRTGILKPEIVEVLGKMIDDYRKGRSKQKIYKVASGIAFELMQLQSYGLPNERLLTALHSNAWLVTPDTNKDSKLMKVKNSDGELRNAIVISFAAAVMLGFIDEA